MDFVRHIMILQSSYIKIKKGLDLPFEGAAERRTTDARGEARYAVKPTDYVGLVPRLLVAEGDMVRRGDALFCDKHDARIRFTAPCDGRVCEVVRGERRQLQAVVVEKTQDLPLVLPLEDMDVKEAMLRTGLWTMLRQRPFGIVANPDSHPKAVVVSCFDSAPLAPDYDFMLQGRETDFCHGLEALAALAGCPIHLCFRPQQGLHTIVEQWARTASCPVGVHVVDGPHPAGNVGTQIARLCPINKGDVVWTMGPQEVAMLGLLVRTGEYRPEKYVAVAGPQAMDPHYYQVFSGVSVSGLLSGQVPQTQSPRLGEEKEMTFRYISGNVLSGTQVAADGFLSGYDSLLTLLPEGDYYDFMGWLLPGVRKHSFSRTFLSGFLPSRSCKCRFRLPDCVKPRFDTNVHGSVRPLVFTGNFERVFPFDIYPLQLLKACIIGDMELQENLGIYEVEPEDFALCEYIDISKTDIQPIIREALEKLRKEAL